ncbi:MAG: C4-type zinc ribbon domain-containing protein [Prevotellaceae bacterium]|jgi:predicted  nucleic acid-binding Zn-ribbon protein|nr:C4-type zinc ribbon domain-containing protein [Prevotellaceae bacterium]
MAKRTEPAKTVKKAVEQRADKDAIIQRILADKPKPAGDSVEQKLHLLYELQMVDSEIDNIHVLRGELPNEVKSLEDDIVGLETRMSNIKDDIKKTEMVISQRKIDIENAKALIKKYEEQQKNVRNNREFESLAKEIEFQGLEIELAEKNIKEANSQIKEKKTSLDAAATQFEERKVDLQAKQAELKDIVANTEKEEKTLFDKSEEYHAVIESRLLNAYQRLRKNARNGLAVVEVRRDACGGCFNKIPPQRQVDIRMSKRIIPCEYCGRILVDWEQTAEEK